MNLVYNFEKNNINVKIFKNIAKYRYTKEVDQIIENNEINNIGSKGINSDFIDNGKWIKKNKNL